VIVTAEFERLAHQLAKHHKHDSLRVLVLPYPLEGLSPEELTSIAANSYPSLVRLIGAEPDGTPDRPTER
jgi:hypothetical protein